MPGGLHRNLCSTQWHGHSWQFLGACALAVVCPTARTCLMTFGQIQTQTTRPQLGRGNWYSPRSYARTARRECMSVTAGVMVILCSALACPARATAASEAGSMCHRRDSPGPPARCSGTDVTLPGPDLPYAGPTEPVGGGKSCIQVRLRESSVPLLPEDDVSMQLVLFSLPSKSYLLQVAG